MTIWLNEPLYADAVGDQQLDGDELRTIGSERSCAMTPARSAPFR